MSQKATSKRSTVRPRYDNSVVPVLQHRVPEAWLLALQLNVRQVQETDADFNDYLYKDDNGRRFVIISYNEDFVRTKVGLMLDHAAKDTLALVLGGVTGRLRLALPDAPFASVCDIMPQLNIKTASVGAQEG